MDRIRIQVLIVLSDSASHRSSRIITLRLSPEQSGGGWNQEDCKAPQTAGGDPCRVRWTGAEPTGSMRFVVGSAPVHRTLHQLCNPPGLLGLLFAPSAVSAVTLFGLPRTIPGRHQ